MEGSYNDTQLLTNYPNGIENHYWNASRNIILEKVLNRQQLKNKTLLEIGCGRGVVVQYLNERGFDCWGVDLAAGEPIKKSTKIYMSKSAFDLDASFRNKVDAILLLDVIEHLPSPEEFLLKVKESFPNALYYLLTVPARQELWSNYDEFYGHFRRYNKEMLVKHTKGLTGKIVRLTYFFHLLYYPARVLKGLKIKRNVYLLPPKGIFQKLIHTMFKWLFYIEFKIVPGIVPGTSLLGVIRLSDEK
ncbi:MAG: class I SAM-dependent methyltransferase [Bacteroidota bacterium]|nr:MAG: class I SAM-dependent methyltransferase [Bacteroidota bacterium]